MKAATDRHVTEPLGSTPLLALDAIGIDTETTGLDPARARMVELAGVRLEAGRLAEQKSYRSLINPGQPIPPAATAIHGIDDAQVAGAPSFAQAWNGFCQFAGVTVLIGHNVGFDLAVVARECERAGIDFKSPRSLCVRTLAEIIRPDLPDYGLEQLAAWLGITVEGRHSALGDAVTACRIFVALVPQLRAAGVRTLAEALATTARRREAVPEPTGWIAGSGRDERSGFEPTLARIDSYPYRHRAGDVMSTPPLFIAPTAPVEHTLKRMAEHRVSSLFVAANADGPAAEVGIVTERDVQRAIAAEGVRALSAETQTIATRPLIRIGVDEFLYRALGRMDRRRIRHLGVVDAADRLVGALSARDLLRVRAQAAIALGDELDEAVDVRALAAAWGKVPAVARALVGEGVSAREIAAVISHEVRTLTARSAIVIEQDMRAAGLGPPPVDYAVLVLGSAGRGESLLALDQDNAILFERGDPGGAEDRWFAAFGERLADLLHEVGLPYCPGGVMARNAVWRGSQPAWRERLAEWISRSSPEDLLSVDIFFDFRAVYGSSSMADTLWGEAYARAGREAAFLKLLAEASGAGAPPVSWFGIATDQGRVDLKRGALFGIVAAARVLAIRYGIRERATPARLQAVKRARPESERDLDALIEAHSVLLDAILSQQLVDIAGGLSPTNRVDPKRLNRGKYQQLKQALQSVRHLDEMVRDLLFND